MIDKSNNNNRKGVVTLVLSEIRIKLLHSNHWGQVDHPPRHIEILQCYSVFFFPLALRNQGLMWLTVYDFLWLLVAHQLVHEALVLSLSLLVDLLITFITIYTLISLNLDEFILLLCLTSNYLATSIYFIRAPNCGGFKFFNKCSIQSYW